MSDISKKIENFEKALTRLEEGILSFDNIDDLKRDGLIQRFEFTFELVWKTLKSVFEEEGILGLNSPKLILKEAYVAEMIKDQTVWLTMLVDRNSTSHIYSETLAIEICQRIIKIYVVEIRGLLENIKKRMG